MFCKLNVGTIVLIMYLRRERAIRFVDIWRGSAGVGVNRLLPTRCGNRSFSFLHIFIFFVPHNNVVYN